MKWLWLIVLVVCVGFFGWPLLNENASSTCTALEDLAARQIMANFKADSNASPGAVIWGNLLVNGLTVLSQGKIAATNIKQSYPNLPPFVGCAMLYYQHVADTSLPYAATPNSASVAPPAPDTTSNPAAPIPTFATPAPTLLPKPEEITTPGAIPVPAVTPTPEAISLFAAYPAGPIYTGPHAAPDLTEPRNYNFRTRIRATSRQAPNFAGRWVLVKWGCGTGCNDGRLVNIATGTVVSLPAAVISDPLPEPNGNVYTYARESRLLIVNGHDGESDTTAYSPRCYVLNDGVTPDLTPRECVAPATLNTPYLARQQESLSPRRDHPLLGPSPQLSGPSEFQRPPAPVPTARKCFVVYPALPPADCFAH